MKPIFSLPLSIWICMSSTSSWAGTTINTIGSTDGVAISGFDTVAFFLQKRAVSGSAQYAYEWSGAKWYFATEENLAQFKGEPEKWAPQYGGHCALGASDGYLSTKPTSGLFEVINAKLYLFPRGNNGQNGAYDDWRRTGGEPKRRIENGVRNWPQLKATLGTK